MGAESVQTGGLMSFRHARGSQPRLDDSEKREIEDAYAVADERKKKESRRRIIYLLIILILILVVGAWFIFF